MTTWLTALPTWGLIRFSGIASYLLLFAGVVTGILGSLPQAKGPLKARLYRLHSNTLGIGFLLGLAHGMLLAVDAYMPYSWREVIVPFAAAQDPLWAGLGSLAFYGSLLILLTTDFKALIGGKAWRMIHLLAYPVFAMTLLHGLGSGTDSSSVWMKGCYAVTGLAVVSLTAVRAAIGKGSADGRPAAGGPRNSSSRTAQKPAVIEVEGFAVDR
ncbi:hypothetical protein J31TS4_38160 [Paenibacillus sp. J31TS4]|uniref:ferric reductase n=1 Tax=Paenibacillus sp. J31TS4 TaxID=2807195 RepID=UPI001AFE8D93|nr:ferric reductase [Paenibacillus sp. J31TS4]GIP40536.1 hypothetical protein J31TS4_38160 [Paenibacillus sp. J31TS4]